MVLWVGRWSWLVVVISLLGGCSWLVSYDPAAASADVGVRDGGVRDDGLVDGSVFDLRLAPDDITPLEASVGGLRCQSSANASVDPPFAPRYASDPNGWTVHRPLFRDDTGWATIKAAWASGEGDVWLGGAKGWLVHRHGADDWRRVDYNISSDIHALWGDGQGQIFVATDGLVQLTVGPTEMMVNPIGPPVNALTALDGWDASSVWAGGKDGLLRWDGGPSIKKVEFSTSNEPVLAIAALGANLALVVTRKNVYRGSGNTWNETPLDNSIGSINDLALHRFDDGKVWGVDDRGRLLDFTEPGKVTLILQTKLTRARAIGGKTTDQVWIAGDDEVQRLVFNGSTLVSSERSLSSNYRIQTLLDVGQSVYAAGTGGTVFRLAQGRWRWQPLAYSGTYRAIATTPDNGWLLTPTRIFRHCGFGLELVHERQTPPYFVDLTARLINDKPSVWVVGSEGLVLRYDDVQGDFVQIDAGTQADLRAVWIDGDGGDVWIGGSGGVVRRRKGSAWSSVELPTNTWVGDLWGSGKTLRAVTTGGRIYSLDLNSDQASWQLEQQLASKDELVAIHGGWALGRKGSLYAKNPLNGTWYAQSEPQPPPTAGYDLFSGSKSALLGAAGGLYRYEPASGSWKRVAGDLFGAPQTIYGVWANQTDSLAVGSGGLIASSSTGLD